MGRIGIVARLAADLLEDPRWMNAIKEIFLYWVKSNPLAFIQVAVIHAEMFCCDIIAKVTELLQAARSQAHRMSLLPLSITCSIKDAIFPFNFLIG